MSLVFASKELSDVTTCWIELKYQQPIITFQNVIKFLPQSIFCYSGAVITAFDSAKMMTMREGSLVASDKEDEDNDEVRLCLLW